METLLEEITTRAGSRPGDVLLGGFSQGAMVSAEIAFRSDTPLKALILLSPTVVDEPSWRDGIPLRRGLPVFIAHGRQDEVLPFSASARLAETLRTAGLNVTWVPFDGEHDIRGPSSTPSTSSLPASPLVATEPRARNPAGPSLVWYQCDITSTSHGAAPSGRLPGRAGWLRR